MERRAVSVKEAAKMLGLSRNGAYAAVARGDIPSLRIGRRVVIPLAALEKLLEVDVPASKTSGSTTGGVADVHSW